MAILSVNKMPNCYHCSHAMHWGSRNGNAKLFVQLDKCTLIMKNIRPRVVKGWKLGPFQYSILASDKPILDLLTHLEVLDLASSPRSGLIFDRQLQKNYRNELLYSEACIVSLDKYLLFLAKMLVGNYADHPIQLTRRLTTQQRLSQPRHLSTMYILDANIFPNDNKEAVAIYTDHVSAYHRGAAAPIRNSPMTTGTKHLEDNKI